MISEPADEMNATPANLFGPDDVASILRERGWLQSAGDEQTQWSAAAAALLGPKCANREALTELLRLIFEYDAAAALALPESHAVLASEGAREVLRALAIEILSGGPVDSARLKEIVTAIKQKLPYRNREIFWPLRMALAGRVGEGELDRVVLLLDTAAQVPGLAPVKSVRTRILEFCAALD
jgi:hypothetical protein